MIEINKSIYVGDPNLKMTAVAMGATGGVVVFDKPYTIENDNLVREPDSKLFSKDIAVGDGFGTSMVITDEYMYVSAPKHRDLMESKNLGVVYISKVHNNKPTRADMLHSVKLHSPLNPRDNQDYGAQLVVESGRLYVLANGKQSKVSKTGMSKIMVYNTYTSNFAYTKVINIKDNVKAFKVCDSDVITYITKEGELKKHNIKNGSGKSYGFISNEAEVFTSNNELYVVEDNELIEICYTDNDVECQATDIVVPLNTYTKICQVKSEIPLDGLKRYQGYNKETGKVDHF